MSKTIDGVDFQEVQHLWKIENDKVIQFLPELQNHRTYRKILELNCHLCYSTELAATQELLRFYKNELLLIDKKRLEIANKILKLESSECMTIKIPVKGDNKPQKVGNVRI